MDTVGMNVNIFNEAVAKLAETRPGDTAEQTTYLGLIAHSMASIADSLEKIASLSDRDPLKEMWEEIRNA